VEFSLVICTYNRCDYLRDTLEDVARLLYPNKDFEVLVINNNSTDDTVGVVNQAIEMHPHLNLRLIKEENQGLSFARNRAFEEAQSDYLIFIDDDVFLPDVYLQNWQAFVNQFPSAEMAGGPIEVHIDGPTPNWFPMILKQILGNHRPYKTSKRYSRGAYPLGGNLLVHKKSGLRAGAFNTTIGRIGSNLIAGEEKDLAQRIRKSGGEIVFNAWASLRHRIGSERLTKDYIARQARGVGLGDRLQHNTVFDTVKWLFIQEAKWAASFAISLIYLVGLQPQKASIVLKFRWWVLQGYFKKKGVAR
jgi:glucosyl-dolichyl phosphate glucuronosyltransferase